MYLMARAVKQCMAAPSKDTVRNSRNSVANITSFGKNRGAGVANCSLSIIYLLVVEYREPMGTFY